MEKDKARASMLKRAQGICSRFSNLVPKAEEREISWPKETEVKWYQVFGTEAPSPFCLVGDMGFLPFREVRNLPAFRDVYRGL